VEVVRAVAAGRARVVAGKAAAVASWVVKMVDKAATAVEKAVAVVVGKAPPPVGVGGGEKGGCSSIRPTGSNRPCHAGRGMRAGRASSRLRDLFAS